MLMRNVSSVSRSAALIVLLITIPSCALFGGSSGGSGGDITVEVSRELSQSEYRALLDDAVRRRIAATSGRAKSEFVSRKPYYYKTYAEYPDGPDGFAAHMRDTDSPTAPMAADVTINTRRFSTRLSRNSERARQDENYLRDTGEETVSLAFRNGKWRRMGSLFVAERTEELIDGEWVRTQKEIPRAPGDSSSEKAGWLSRLKFWR